MVKLALNAGSDTIAINIEVEPWKPTIFVGMNSMLKSATARTLAICCPDCEPRLSSYGAACSVELVEETGPKHIDCNEWFCEFVSDVRVSLREWLYRWEEIDRIMKDLDSLNEALSGDEVARSWVNEIKNRMIKLVDSAVLSIGEKYLRLKTIANMGKFSTYAKLLDKVIEEMHIELKKIFGEDVDEFDPKNLLPLDVEISIDPKALFRGLPLAQYMKISVVDKRLGKEIKRDLVSSAVASALLFKLVAAFMSVEGYRYKFLAVEEPEEALSPPQQVLFARYLEKCLEYAKDNDQSYTFIVITTHSPYIALAFEEAEVYYFRYVKRRFIVEKGALPRPFSLGDLLLLHGT